MQGNNGVLFREVMTEIFQEVTTESFSGNNYGVLFREAIKAG